MHTWPVAVHAVNNAPLRRGPNGGRQCRVRSMRRQALLLSAFCCIVLLVVTQLHALRSLPLLLLRPLRGSTVEDPDGRGSTAVIRILIVFRVQVHAARTCGHARSSR